MRLQEEVYVPFLPVLEFLVDEVQEDAGEGLADALVAHHLAGHVVVAVEAFDHVVHQDVVEVAQGELLLYGYSRQRPVCSAWTPGGSRTV